MWLLGLFLISTIISIIYFAYNEKIIQQFLQYDCDDILFHYKIKPAIIVFFASSLLLFILLLAGSDIELFMVFILSVMASLCITITPYLVAVYNSSKTDKVIKPYCVCMGLLSLCIMTISLMCIQSRIGYVIFFSIVLFLTLIAMYCYLNSAKRKNKKLINFIATICPYIKNAITKIDNFEKSGLKDRELYNHCVKEVNRNLTYKQLHNTFQPIFYEDKTVKNIVNLFQIMGKGDVAISYNNYKKTFINKNMITLPEKAKRKEPLEEKITKLHTLRGVLYNALIGNLTAVKQLQQNNVEEKLYKRYRMFQVQDTVSKFRIINLLLVVTLEILIGGWIIFQIIM